MGTSSHIFIIVCKVYFTTNVTFWQARVFAIGHILTLLERCAPGMRGARLCVIKVYYIINVGFVQISLFVKNGYQ